MTVMSSQLYPIKGSPDFWDRVAAAQNLVLALDYDGTLAPFHIDRDKAVPIPESVRILKQIVKDTPTRVVIVSGRPLAELEKFIGDLNVEFIAAHGYELKLPGQPVARTALEPTQKSGLDEALQIMQPYAEHLEIKPASLAVHTRGVANADKLHSIAIQTWKPIAEKSYLEVREFNGGVELRAIGRDKGTALRDLIKDRNETFVVYIGDDETDEDVFRMLGNNSGIGIRIGNDDYPTAATGHLKSWDNLTVFLESWYSRFKQRE